MDGPTSHRGELVYAGRDQIDQHQCEHDLLVEDRGYPAAGRRSRSALAELARVLLLCTYCCYAPRRTTRLPEGYRLHDQPWCALPLAGWGDDAGGSLS